MLLYDTLDTLAELSIPEGTHEIFHVNSRQAWVNIVGQLFESKALSFNKPTLSILLSNWESLLYLNYSKLN